MSLCFNFRNLRQQNLSGEGGAKKGCFREPEAPFALKA
jgi:hypothetical protein